MVGNTKKIFLLYLILFIITSFNLLAVNQQDYMPGEIIIKLKDNARVVASDSASAIKVESNSIEVLFSKHKVKSMKKILKKYPEVKIARSSVKPNSLKQYGLDRLYLIKMPKDVNMHNAIRDFNRNPNVEYAEPNYIVSINLLPNDHGFPNLYGLHNTGQTGGTSDADIDAPEAWEMQKGSNNVLIAVIDTGVDYNHKDLNANMWENPGEVAGNGIDDDSNGFIDDVNGWDFYNNDNEPFDDNGHGTHVTGIIGAVGDNSIGVVGVNWNVKILPIKFLDSSGSGSIADAISAIQYATLMGVDIMSNSWGGGFSQALKDAITAANDSGILFVAAAGNNNNNNDVNPFYPASNLIETNETNNALAGNLITIT